MHCSTEAQHRFHPTLRLACLALAVGAFSGGCKPSGPASHRPAAVIVSGDTAGWITPCGCTYNQSGGLPRRASFLQQVREQSDVIYADVGGAASGTSDYQRVKFEAIIRGELAMDVAAHNIGASEAALGATYLRQLASHLGVPFVSANVRDEGGRLVDSPLRIVNAGGRRIALCGVLSPRFPAGAMRIDDPKAAVLSVIADSRRKYDSLIVLAYLPEEEMAQLAAALPEVDAIIGGPTGQSIQPRNAGPVLLASATNKGKFLVRLDAQNSSAKWSATVTEMNSVFADEPGQKQNIRAYLAALATQDFTAERSGLVQALPATRLANYRIAGDVTCRRCHEAEDQAANGSKHARAWEDLKSRGSHVDPDCQHCHTNAYGMPGGFDSAARTPSLSAVGCESCHGPSMAHVKDPKVRTPFLASGQCVRCHDRENSPNFEYARFWKQLQHGRTAATQPATATTGEVVP